MAATPTASHFELNSTAAIAVYNGHMYIRDARGVKKLVVGHTASGPQGSVLCSREDSVAGGQATPDESAPSTSSLGIVIACKGSLLFAYQRSTTALRQELTAAPTPAAMDWTIAASRLTFAVLSSASLDTVGVCTVVLSRVDGSLQALPAEPVVISIGDLLGVLYLAPAAGGAASRKLMLDVFDVSLWSAGVWCVLL